MDFADDYETEPTYHTDTEYQFNNPTGKLVGLDGKPYKLKTSTTKPRNPGDRDAFMRATALLPKVEVTDEDIDRQVKFERYGNNINLNEAQR
jgi:hypothetical protein